MGQLCACDIHKIRSSLNFQDTACSQYFGRIVPRCIPAAFSSRAFDFSGRSLVPQTSAFACPAIFQAVPQSRVPAGSV